MASADRMCPMEGCGETGMSPDSLIPNKFLRTAVTNFLNETGYTKAGKSGVDTPPPAPAAPLSPDAPKNRGFYRPPREDSPHVPTDDIPEDLRGFPPHIVAARMRERQSMLRHAQATQGRDSPKLPDFVVSTPPYA